MTPNIAIVRIQTPHWCLIPLWIPLFLLWIPALIFAPIVLLAIVGLSIAGRIDPWRAISALWNFVSALPGTQVRVVADGAKVSVRIL